ncbi:MAG: hypothetical protein LCH54_05310 [Bacteroidetes bacterium]|nr:hypothetical protein [Bacteroidota bacterium]
MKKLIFLFGFLTLFSCSDEEDTKKSTGGNQITPDSVKNIGTLSFSIDEKGKTAAISGLYYHRILKKYLFSYSDGVQHAGGIYGFFTLNTLQTGVQNWSDIDSSKAIIYSVFTGFDPEFETRYYSVPDSGKTEVVSSDQNEIKGVFSGKILSPGKGSAQTISGSFSVKNKPDSLSFVFGYY